MSEIACDYCGAEATSFDGEHLCQDCAQKKEEITKAIEVLWGEE